MRRVVLSCGSRDRVKSCGPVANALRHADKSLRDCPPDSVWYTYWPLEERKINSCDVQSVVWNAAHKFSRALGRESCQFGKRNAATPRGNWSDILTPCPVVSFLIEFSRGILLFIIDYKKRKIRVILCLRLLGGIAINNRGIIFNCELTSCCTVSFLIEFSRGILLFIIDYKKRKVLVILCLRSFGI